MKIKILLIALVLSSCAATPKGDYVVTTYDSAGEVKKEYFIKDYDQGPDGVSFKSGEETVKVSGSFKVERVKK